MGVFPSRWLHPNGLDLCHSLPSSYVKFICFPYLDFTKCFLLNYPSCQFLPILAVLLLFPEMWHSSLNASSPLQLYLHKRFSGISVWTCLILGSFVLGWSPGLLARACKENWASSAPTYLARTGNLEYLVTDFATVALVSQDSRWLTWLSYQSM